MATEFLIPSEDVTITDERRKELVHQFYDTFLCIMDEFHGVNLQFHPDNQASEYVNADGKEVFENLSAHQVDDMLNAVDAGLKALGNKEEIDAIYAIAMRKFHHSF